MKISEMMGTGVISDERLLKIIRDCIEDVRSIGYEINNDIDFMYGDSVNTFGTMLWPKNEDSNFTLVLNKYMTDDEEEAIKDTVYHELAHYLEMKDEFEDGVVYWWSPSHLAYDKTKYNKSLHSSHGQNWKRIAKNISNNLHLKKAISTTDKITNHSGVKVHSDEFKYIVTCKNCGQEYGYHKKTEFVKDPNAMSKYGTGYRYKCPKCGAKGQFEVKESDT